MQKHTFYMIEQAIRSFAASVKIPNVLTENEVYMAIRQVMRENPDIFWISSDQRLWRYSQTEATVRFRYTIDQTHSEKIKVQIDDVVLNDFKLEYVRTLSVKEQVMYVYKWIALYCSYDIHSAHNQTIYSVFVHRHSVCTGIAKAAQYLLKLLGIESRLVFGNMNNSEKDSRHCWLIVNIEERWYHFDPTFALPETEHLLHKCGVKLAKGDEKLFYNFFCVNTDFIKQSRTIEEEERLPICNERIDYHHLQKLVVTPSRNAEKMGLGCMLSWSGTTADVYIAHHKNIHNRCRSVAKVYGNDPGRELLRKELLVMEECAGPHVLQSTYADFEKGILFMEQATPLSELLSSFYFKLTVKDFCDLLLDVCKGLQELRSHGIIYRDIHLNNIFLSHTIINGRRIYKLGDFGSCTFLEKDGKFAWLTEQGGIGSKWYMAPETWESLKFERLTHEPYFNECSAVYGVGMIAYYLLNELYPPFWNELEVNSFEARIHARQLPPPQLLIYSGLLKYKFDFVFKAIKKEMADRYSSLDSLMTDIEVFKKHIPENVVIIDGALIRNSAYIDYRSDKRKGHTEDENAYDNSSMVEDYSASLERVPLNKYAYHPNAGFSAHEVHSSIFEPEPEALDYDNASVINKSARTCPVDESFQQQNDDSTLIGDFAATCVGHWNAYDNHTSDDAVDFDLPSRKRVDDFATTCAHCHPNSAAPYDGNRQQKKHSESFFPRCNNRLIPQKEKNLKASPALQSSKSLFGKIRNLIFGKTENLTPATATDRTPFTDKVNSSIFAPSETKRDDWMMIQVFLYKDDEERAVACKAAEVDPDARRQNYTTLSVKLKDGDRVKAKLTMSGKGIEVDEPIQEMIWQGHYTDCQFGVFVPEDYKPCTMIGTVMLTVNDIPCGRMMFKTRIVKCPQKLFAKVETKTFHKIFISYSHRDEATVKYFARAFKAQGVDYFFDRHYLKAGDVYPLKIKEYINSADLFILCWSKNAAESEYVQLERQQALALAFPQRDMEHATLSIHPISIEPHADYPNDMKEVYNFEEI